MRHRRSEQNVIKHLHTDLLSAVVVNLPQLIQLNNNWVHRIYLQSLVVAHSLQLPCSVLRVVSLGLHHLHHGPHVCRYLAEEDAWYRLEPFRKGHFSYKWLAVLLQPEAE